MKVFCILILSILSYARAIASQACNPVANPPAETAKEIYKNMALEAAKNPADLCKRNALLEYLEGRDSKTNYTTLSTSQLEDAAKLATTQDHQRYLKILEPKKIILLPDPEVSWAGREYRDPWKNSLIPIEERRRAAVDLTLEKMQSNISGLENDFSQPQPLSLGISSNVINNIQRLNQTRQNDQAPPAPNSMNPPRSSNLPSNFKQFLGCADLGLLGASECTKAMGKIIADALPVGANYGSETKFSDLTDWKEIMSNPKYDEGLRLTALSLARRYQGKENLSKDANIFDDLKASFMKSNMSAKQAEDASLATLAVIANGSANTIGRVAELESKDINNFDPDPSKNPALSQKGKALSFIAAVLPYMDEVKSQSSGSLYSMPKNVHSVCDNSKSYHFWMIARLAQRAKIEGQVSSEAAAKAAFTLEKGYQLRRDVGRPDNDSNNFKGGESLAQNAFDSSPQMDRTDYSFAAAGAFFGANFDKQASMKLDADSSIPKLIQKATVLPPLQQDELNSMGMAQKFLRLNQLLVPNEAFLNIQSQSEK